jgi:hypothetical protein
MIYKTLDQLANELAESVERISKLTDLDKFYEAQQNLFAQKEDANLYEVILGKNNTEFCGKLSRR